MNVLEVQDALKDFSQEQLIKEMQMPSGQAPQFLVLSELNRRQRMKQDFEARQAQQQPTVAEKLVAAAGAPQGGIGAMAQSMAPQTDMAMNTGISQMQQPMSGEVMAMQEGGSLNETVLQQQQRMKDIPFPQFRDSQGNLKYTYGDPDNPFLNEEGQKGGSILGMGAKYLKDQLAGQLGRGGGSTVMAPPAEVGMSEMDIPKGDESTRLRNILSALASRSSEGQREANAMASEKLDEPLRLNTGGTPMFYIGNTQLGTAGSGFSVQDLIDMADKQGLTPQEYAAKLEAANMPITPLSGGMTFTQAINARNQRGAGAGPTAQPAAYQPSGGGGIFGMSAQAATLDEPTEEDDEGSFLDSVGGFLEDRYFGDDGDFDLSQAIFDAGGIATLAIPGGAVARGLYAGAKALPRLLSGQGIQTAAGKTGRLLQKGFTKERKTDRPVPTTGSAPRTQEFVDRVFSPKRTAQVGGPLLMGGALAQEFIEGMGQGVPPAGEDDKNKGAGEGTGAGAGGGQETTQDRIMDLLEKRQKSADMDKYLALAQAGFTLMQPAEGGFAEALGKAGIAGVQAYQDAEDRYQTGLADILDTEIAFAKLGETRTERAETYSQIIERLSKLAEMGDPKAQETINNFMLGLQENSPLVGTAV